jgi:hypothetical protein
VLQIYVDDIIFGSTNQGYCEEFGKMMANEFEMSMIEELFYFLGLQIKQLKNGTCHTHLSTKWNAYPYVRPEINHT